MKLTQNMVFWPCLWDHIFLHRVWEICESCELLVAVSHCELPSPHFCCYCFIVTCNLQHLVVVQDLVLHPDCGHLRWLSVFSGSRIDGSKPRGSWIAIFRWEWEWWYEWERDSPGMHVVYTVYLLVTACTQGDLA